MAGSFRASRRSGVARPSPSPRQRSRGC
jgi:hypothetical protein